MANTIITKNSSTASAVPTSGDLVQGELAVNVTDKRLFTEDSGGNVVEVGTNPSQLNFADNAKAIFGAGSDLQIYHDGSHSYIDEKGTGRLYINSGNGVWFGNADGSEIQAKINVDSSCEFRYDNSIKLTTTSTGIDVTGTVVSDGLQLDGGTANGVAYLNGSKVLTTGSALTFDGTNFKVGTGITLATGGPYFSGGNIDAGATSIAIGGSLVGFFTGGSEQMRLTSTGLGIGTSSPSVKLHVASTGRDVAIIESTDGGALNGPYLNLYRNSASPAASDYLGFLQFSGKNSTGSAVDYAFIGAQATQVTTSPAQKGDLVFFTANQASPAERMRIDSSGNVGIGTSSPNGRLTVSGSSLATSWTVFGQRSDNTTLSGMTTWESASGNVGVRNNAGALTFMTGGTIGTSIGDERMRLDSSGNLGLGVTPSAWGNAGNLELSSRSISFQGQANILSNAYFSGTWKYTNTTAPAFYTQASGQHQWFTAPSGTAGSTISFTQAMTLDASGNLGVGTSSPSSASGYGYFTVNGTSGAFFEQQVNGSAVSKIYTNSDGMNLWCTGASTVMRFHTQATERARIDSSGNLLVGTGGTNPSSSVAGLRIGAAGFIEISRGSGTTSWSQLSFINGNGTVGTVSTSGTTTSYNTSSDYRLKENIQPMIGALAKVAALKPCIYKWKADGSDGEGFIAHELAEVVPQCVTGEKDAVDADGKPVYQGIDTSFLVATLTAAIQELKAEFDAYKASHP